MLRTSSYTIFVDLPEQQDKLLVQGYTGAYDRVSAPVADYLRRHKPRPTKPLYGEWTGETADRPDSERLPEELLEQLRSRGYLTELDPDQEQQVFSDLARRLHERAIRQPPSYIFIPSYDCNLRCGYCFQDAMRTDCSFKHLLSTMKPAMVDRIFDRLPELEARQGFEAGPGHRRSIGLFGGEPLLARHRAIVEHILQRGHDLGDADYWAVTNATELEAYVDLLGPLGIARLQITLDGPPELHDTRRVDAQGGGTFERIARNIDLALERDTQVSVRVNVDRDNLHELRELAAELHRREWSLKPNFSAYVAPIRPQAGTPKGTTLDTWQLDRALSELHAEDPATQVLERPDDGMRSRMHKLFAGHQPMPQLRPSFCGAHDQMFIFDAFGDIYACWERTGDSRVRIGHVPAEGDIEINLPVHREWRSRNVASNSVCGKCRFALHCGGGCAILALEQRGKFHSNYCDGFAARFRTSVAEAYAQFAAGTEIESTQRVCTL